VPSRAQQIGGVGGLLTHLHTVCMACFECLPTRMNHLAERTCFSQVPSATGDRADAGGAGDENAHGGVREDRHGASETCHAPPRVTSTVVRRGSRSSTPRGNLKFTGLTHNFQVDPAVSLRIPIRDC
jgi:hypothetical protein